MITRCVLAFHRRLQRTDYSSEAFNQLLGEQPEVCPHSDCSPGGCKHHCEVFALGEWVKARKLKKEKAA